MSHRFHACCRSSRAAGPREFALPRTAPVYERDRPFRVVAVKLAIDVSLDEKRVAGRATLSVRRVDAGARTLILDAVSLDVASVTADGSPALFVDDGATLRVTMPDVDACDVVVEYATTPRRGIYFLAPDAQVPGRPTQAWTQFQDEDARHVFPCIDKPHEKFVFEAVVGVARGLSVLSNGTLASRTEEGDRVRFHWAMKQPLPAYLVSIVIGEFEVIDDGVVASAPVSYWVPRAQAASTSRSLGRTPAMMKHFGELTGVPYPFEKYAQVVVNDFSFGGMENTTATTLYEHVMLDERAALDVTSDDLVAHELAHQWFGDLVTCRDFSHGWLNEGFATYFEHLDREANLGGDEYLWGLKNDEAAYVGEAKGRYERPIVSNTYDAPIDLFDRHLYEKGGLVLHLLRRTLGDRAFFAGIRAYLTRHAHGVVETRDLQRALEEESGRSLDRFFAEWVYRAGHPEVTVAIEWADGALHVNARQSATRTFALSLEIDVVLANGTSRRETLSVDRADVVAAFACAERPELVVVDPRHLVVGELSVTLGADWLRAGLARGPTARGRWMAAERLGKIGDPRAIAALSSTLANQAEFWGVRAECAAALGEIRSPESREALAALITTKHPKVRRAIVSALGKWKGRAAFLTVAATAAFDESILVEAEAQRAIGRSREPDAFDALVSALDRPSWGDTIACGAIDGLASLRDLRAVPLMIARTAYGAPSRVRRAAIRALPKLSHDRDVREALEELLDDRDPHVRVEAVGALVDLCDPASTGALTRAGEREHEARVRRRIKEALRDLSTGAKDEVKRLSDRLEELEHREAELRARLAKLEAERKPG